MSKAYGRTATWIVALGAIAGLVRAASEDVSARAAGARETLAATARSAGVELQADREPTPTITLASMVGVQPGASAPLTAPGRYTAGSAASMRRGPFTLSGATVSATAVTGTVSVAAGALPAVGTLEVVTPRGTARAYAGAAYVAGRWTFDLKAPNGWRIELATDVVTAQTAGGSLPTTVKFFKGADTTPFETRPGQLSGSDGGTSVSVSLSEKMPGGSAECDQVLTRYQQLATELGKNPSEKLMAEFEKLTGRMSTCMEQQQKAVMEQVQKSQDPAFQAAEQKRRDDFGCTYVRLESVAAGSVKGTATCGKNVGQLALTGAVTHAAK
jgi:hypothetical protein